MATSTRARKTSAPKQGSTPAARPADTEPDLLSQIEDRSGETSSDDNEEFDILDEIEESTGDPWQPADYEDHPRGIQGRVTAMTTMGSDYGDEDIPALDITESDGHVWTVRGYHTVLRNQIDRAAPVVGDWIGIKYFGQRDNRKGTQKYESYAVLVKRK